MGKHRCNSLNMIEWESENNRKFPFPGHRQQTTIRDRFNLVVAMDWSITRISIWESQPYSIHTDSVIVQWTFLSKGCFKRSRDAAVGITCSLIGQQSLTVPVTYNIIQTSPPQLHQLYVIAHAIAFEMHFSDENHLNFQLSKQIANTFIHWFSKGLCDKTFHLIGHSLGGEMCGMIGRAVQDQSNGAYKLGRFSALDPAAPLFFPPGQIYPHVSPNDATFVDVYHTDATANGAPIPVGTVDFWLNDPDQIQPGCVLRKNLSNLRILLIRKIV